MDTRETLPAPRRVRACAVMLMTASGFAGLGYQIVWTQQSAVWLGHEAAAMLAIVAAFFGGLGLGAWMSGKWIGASAAPARWYASCEAAIGIWGIALVFLMAPASNGLLTLLGPHPSSLWQWTVAFAGTFVLLLPATAAMGATLPAMERIVAAVRAHRLPVAMVYAANTFGAVLGVLVTAFVLVPGLGLTRTAAICAALNLLAALVTLRTLASPAAPPSEPRRSRATAALFPLALTGLLGIGYEVLVVRALSQVAENTVFTFAVLLAVYLVGTALGAAAYARWASGQEATLRNQLLRLQCLACLLGMAALFVAKPLKLVLTSLGGGGMRAALLIEAALACIAFLLPTVVMGALFSHLVTTARAAGVNLGTALGVNTIAAALAPLLFGVLLLPVLGTSLSLLLVATGYLLAVNAWSNMPQLVACAAVAAFAFWRPPLAAVDLPEGGKILSQHEGVAATVSIIADAHGVATLHINNRQQEGSSATLYADARQGLLPVLLHPAPGRVLFLGLGTGATARAAASIQTLRVDAVELLPAVITASARFAELQQSPSQAKLQLWPADARRFVRAAPGYYDVIVADNFHPARSGSAALYTREHFAAVLERLAPGGLFCQWLPLHQLDLETTRSIVRTYTSVYPRAWALLATNSLDTPVLGLIARRDGEAFELDDIHAAFSGSRAESAKAVVDDELALLGSFIAAPGSLARFAGGAPLNTDDHPVVAWLAPRITYEPDSTPAARLLALLAETDIQPETLLTATADPAWRQRLASYWRARDLYLQIGSNVRPTRDVRIMLARTRAPLLDVLKVSADFRPAYVPLVHMARELGRTDAAGARDLLRRLAAIRPDWRDARLALAELGAE